MMNEILTEPMTDAEQATARRLAFTAGLRAMADFLDAHPTVQCPIYHTVNVFVRDKARLATIARTGDWAKVAAHDWFSLRREFGHDLALEMNVEREQVCRRVVVGSHIEPAHMVPEQIVEDVEWVCEESLLAGGQS
jgi:hypothetical protein